MDNTPFKFYLKVPRCQYPSRILNGDLVDIPDPPTLRRTSIATDAQECEPSYSIGRLCKMEFNNQLQMYNVKVFDCPIMLKDENQGNNKQWINVNWKIDKEINKIHYFVTSYFNNPQKYIDKIGTDYLLCRPQFSPVLLFCILKFKIHFLRKIKERYLKKKIGIDICKNILNLVPSTPYINIRLAIITKYTF